MTVFRICSLKIVIFKTTFQLGISISYIIIIVFNFSVTLSISIVSSLVRTVYNKCLITLEEHWAADKNYLSVLEKRRGLRGHRRVSEDRKTFLQGNWRVIGADGGRG